MSTKNKIVFLLVFIPAFFYPSLQVKAQKIDHLFIKKNMQFIQHQNNRMLKLLADHQFEPKTMSPAGNLDAVDVHSWTSGYFTAGLWLLYQYTGKHRWYAIAQKKTAFLISHKNNGFVSIGYISCLHNALTITGNPTYKQALLKSAEELKDKYNPKIGTIRVWEGRPQWNFPVIVDFLANLQPLFWATEVTGDSTFYRIAYRIVNESLKHHIRKNFSTAQVAEYDSASGKFLGQRSYQGLNDSSTWSRGQAWAMDGLPEIYKATGNKKILMTAQKVSDYFINHLPDDAVPYWDFDDPDIPYALKDVSAAALACSGLLELYSITKQDHYKKAAEHILWALSSNIYQNHKIYLPPFVLMHSVGNKPRGKEIDVPIIYADYYYLEALLKYDKYCLN